VPAIARERINRTTNNRQGILPARSAGKNTSTHPRTAHRTNGGALVTAFAVPPARAVNTTRFAFWPEDDTEQTRLPSDRDLETNEWLYGAQLFSGLYERE
jgi:hypothetical protein